MHWYFANLRERKKITSYCNSWSQSYQALFLWKQRIFTVFTDKLGHFIAWCFFPYVTNTQAYKRKSETRKNESLVRLTPDLSINIRVTILKIKVKQSSLSTKLEFKNWKIKYLGKATKNSYVEFTQN